MDKKEKQAMYKVLLFIMPFVLMPLLVNLKFRYERFAFESFERSSVKIVSDIINSNQKSYKAEFGKYQTNLNEILYPAANSKELVVYLEADQIPYHVKAELDSEELPYLEPDSYRILIYVKKYSMWSIWFFDSQGEMHRVKSRRIY